ncbi:MAG: SDR family oxidoreductase [Kiritimatiellae bacterium]|nr:SDR family oxidoreductase [Kiritimatiellia bacterium]
MNYCEGKVAVVTGAGGTLCSAIAKDLARQGAKVVLIGRTREKLEKVSAEIAAAGGTCRIEPADVTDEAAIRDIADRVAADWGPCRFLVNGAGGNNVKAMPTRLRFCEKDLCAPALSVGDKNDLPADRGFFDIDMEAFKSVLEINTIGTVISSRIFGLQMAKAGGGAILNFASMNTYRPLTRVAPYAMSKAAIANWTMFFAQYMAPAKVRVNAVAPGFMVNERSRGYLMTPDGGLSPRGEQVMHHTPMGRFGEAQDLLGCVNWLLDDSVSAFVTGITVPVDGGFLSSAGV